MATLKTSSENYVPQTVKNIADLDTVSVHAKISQETKVNDEGKDYTYNYIEVNGEKYRVPASVFAELKEILKVKPDLENIKVSKTGSGLNTKYKVIQL